MEIAISNRFERTLVNPLRRPEKLISEHIRKISVSGARLERNKGIQQGTLNAAAEPLG